VAQLIHWAVVGPEAIVLTLLLEPWVLALLLEKPLKRRTLVLNALLWGALCNFGHPGELIGLERVELATQGHFRGLLACLVLALPFGQSPIEAESGNATSTGKIPGLGNRRI
jgi:hypothetical protein